jgi:hypothetical protein
LPGDWKPAEDNYQKAMPALGYKPQPGEAPQPSSRNLHFGTDAGDLITVQVFGKDKQVTQVHMEGIPAAMLTAIKEKGKDQSKK